MFSYVWPILLVVLSNTVYQICTKGVPEGMNPFTSLVITYLTGAAVAFILSFVFHSDTSVLSEFKKANWTSFGLGLIIVGLETGYIYAYKAGWPVSMAQIVASSLLAVVLIAVGKVLYQEPITWNKIVGIIICLCGLGLINLK